MTLWIYTIAIEFFLMVSITFFQTLLGKKTFGIQPKWKGKRILLPILLVASIETIFQVIALNSKLLAWIGSLIFVSIILYPLLVMQGKIKERLFHGVISLGLFLFASLFTSVILFPAKLTLFIDWSNWITPFIIILFVVVIFAILATLLAHLTTEGKHYIPRKYWLIISLSLAIILVGLLITYYYFSKAEYHSSTRIYLTILSFGLFLIWLFVYAIFIFTCRYFSKVAEANTLKVQKDMIEKYLLRKQASDEKIQVLRHDLKHSLSSWGKLAKEKGDLAALADIQQYEQELEGSLLFNVENENANAVINQKAWEARQAGIVFGVEGIFFDDLLINKLDLCSLLGNLLDNALEAVSKVGIEDQLRKITLSLKRQGNLLLIVVENGYSLEPTLKDGFLQTTKTDTDLHGFGLRSIELIISKYGGATDYTYKNNWFVATIMLMGYGKDISSEN